MLYLQKFQKEKDLNTIIIEHKDIKITMLHHVNYQVSTNHESWEFYFLNNLNSNFINYLSKNKEVIKYLHLTFKIKH